MIFSIVLAVLVALLGILALVSVKIKNGAVARFITRLLLDGSDELLADPHAQTVLSFLGAELIVLAAFVGVPFTALGIDALLVGATAMLVLTYRQLYASLCASAETSVVQLRVLAALKRREKKLIAAVQQSRPADDNGRYFDRVKIGAVLDQLTDELRAEVEKEHTPSDTCA